MDSQKTVNENMAELYNRMSDIDSYGLRFLQLMAA